MSLFATLGDITFQAVASPETISSTRGWNFAEHKTIESAPKLQYTGDELETLQLEMLLHVSFSSPATEIAELEAAAAAHRALALVFANGDHRGYFVITRLARKTIKLADDGSIIAASLTLQLKAYARILDPSAPPVPDFAPAALTSGSTPQSPAGTSALASVPPSSPLPPSLLYTDVNPDIITRRTLS
jgi:phage protein U